MIFRLGLGERSLSLSFDVDPVLSVMALTFTYRPGLDAQGANGAAVATVDAQPAAQGMDQSFSGSFGLAEASPCSDAGSEDAWAMPSDGVAVESAQQGQLMDHSFSCLDLLTAFEGEV